MCGIAGVISLKNSISPEVIQAMTEIVRYRGPDDFGYLAYNTQNRGYTFFKENEFCDVNFNLYFGHRRLSILDLSDLGRQPFGYLNRYWITYNGEIYNYLEIRAELEVRGYTFRSHTDTEVILASYHEWGHNCLKKFNGMWSFAILDIENRSLFCSRDRLGIKPFYFYKSDSLFAFSSEIKQLLTIPEVPKRLNNKVVCDYLYYGTYNSIGADTFFDSIQELPAGHFFIMDLDDNKFDFKCSKYWDIDLQNKLIGLSDSEYASRYLELFRDSVRIRMRSDVPLGSALSGGLDSSGIVSMVSLLLKEMEVPGLQNTFTSVSDHSQFDERIFADEVISKSNAKPHFVLPTAETLWNDHLKLVYHQEEPFISTSIYAGWCISRLIRENGVIVSLDGQGPDEMMGGYLPYTYILGQNLQDNHYLDFLKNLNGFSNYRGLSRLLMIRSSLALLKDNKQNRFISKKPHVFTNDGFEAIVKPYMNKPYVVHSYQNGDPFLSYSYHSTRIDTLPGILKQVDRNSMAFSTETRLPFLDYRLVEYTFSLPMNQKVRSGQTKYVYRNAMKGILPDSIRNRNSKLGFATAESFWFKGYFKQILIDTFNQIPAESPIDKNKILLDFENYISGKSPFSMNFWKVFNFEVWRNSFLR